MAATYDHALRGTSSDRKLWFQLMEGWSEKISILELEQARREAEAARLAEQEKGAGDLPEDDALEFGVEFVEIEDKTTPDK